MADHCFGIQTVLQTSWYIAWQCALSKSLVAIALMAVLSEAAAILAYIC